MKSWKIADFVFLCIWLLQLLASVAMLIAIGLLDMLPTKYFLLVVAACVLLLAGTGALLFVRAGAAGKMKLRRAIASILVTLSVLGCGVTIYAVCHLRNTLSSVTGNQAGGVVMSVYVRVDDPAQRLQDAADYRFASVNNYEVEKTGQTLTYITQNLGKTPNTCTFDSVFAMVDALFCGETDAIVLNSAYVDILLDMDGYADFENKARVLCEVPVDELPNVMAPSETTPSQDEPPVNVEKDVTNTPFIVYISGSDTRSQTLRTSLSDVNILMIVNPVTKQVLLLNTPRDYYVPNPSGNGALDKLTHCGMYGINCSITALEGLYDLDVDYYARINFVGFAKMIDAIGGITVYADESFKTQKYSFQKGENFLNGDMALSFARQRYTVTGGDNGRGRNQMKIITAMIQKLTSSSALITNYPGVMQSLQGMFATDIETQDISKFVKMQLDDMASWTVLSYAVTGKTGGDITYSMPGQKVSVMYIDQKLVDHGKSLVNRMLSGEILTNEDMNVK